MKDFFWVFNIISNQSKILWSILLTVEHGYIMIVKGHKNRRQRQPLHFYRLTSTRLQFSTGRRLPDCSFLPGRQSMLVDAVDNVNVHL